jgi:5-methylcytosine-specific restriction enzyme subunit McrC
LTKPLQIFEYERLKKDDIVTYLKKQYLDKVVSDDELINFEHKAEKILNQFEKYHDREIDKNKNKDKTEIFTLIKDGVKFKQYVGVVRIGSLTIEVLPKIDELNNNNEEDKNLWQGLLYKMVRKAANLDGKLTGFANLNFHASNLISMYIAYFVKEVAYLNRTGLIKKYHRKEGNLTSLKGRLNFLKQISKNLVHAERFYVNYTTYDRDNFLNQILYKALLACRRINTNADLAGKIEAEILNFPEVSNIQVSHALFNKIVFDRKSVGYKNAISLARFILMRLFPALKSGQTDTIAVMFDMNKLYEKYIEIKLKEALGSEYRVTAQDKIDFWKFEKDKSYRKVKPDLVVFDKDNNTVAVLDTKWKVPKEEQFPSIQDLRQMFVYNQYYFPYKKQYRNTNDVGHQPESNFKKRAALVYPAKDVLKTQDDQKTNEGNYLRKGEYDEKSNYGTCDVVYLPIIKTDDTLDININSLIDFIKFDK